MNLQKGECRIGGNTAYYMNMATRFNITYVQKDDKETTVPDSRLKPHHKSDSKDSCEFCWF